MQHRIAVVIILLFFSIPIFAQEKIDWETVAKIRNEGFNHSQVKQTLFYLTDVYGPRLTNSPNFFSAAKWCVKQLSDWGLSNAKLESWGDFGRGWKVDRCLVEMSDPQYVNCISYPKAWTAGTNGTVKGVPVLVDIESEKDFDQYKGKLKDAIVMKVRDLDIKPHFEADAKRYSDEELDEMSMAPDPREGEDFEKRRAMWRERRELRNKISDFFVAESAAVVLEASALDDGTIRVMRGGSSDMDLKPSVPQVVVAAEQYGRIVRLLQHDIPVTLSVNVATTFYDDDPKGYNVIAEIPGTDHKLKDEVVMLGGHLDSWHAGTGATDNAAGCIAAMEAVRILKAINAQPRRTIRLALWSDEEDGLFGSRGYVKKHFGDVETMKLTDEHAKLSAYYNLDNGTGKIRGIYLQGNDAVRPIFEEYLKPFHDLGAETVTIRNTGGTDHLSFNAIGLPGFQFIQDEIDYDARTHHTNMDVYERVLPGDLMQAAVIMASFVYNTAMRDKKLPRKPLPEPRQKPQEQKQHASSQQ